jgi:hypothetical protein
MYYNPLIFAISECGHKLLGFPRHYLHGVHHGAVGLVLNLALADHPIYRVAWKAFAVYMVLGTATVFQTA